MMERLLKRPFLTVFLFALISHLTLSIFLYSRGFQHHDMTDGSQYMTLADNLLAGRGFSERAQEPYVPDAIRTPVYPIYLAASKALTGSYDPSLFLGVILGATIPLAGMVLISLLGRSSRRDLLLIGFLLSVEPHLLYVSLIFGSEATFLPLVAWSIVAAVLVITRPSLRLGLMTGALFGVAVLARPIVQFMPFLIAVFLLVMWRTNAERKTVAWKTAVAILATYVVVVSPWIVRNLRTHGVMDFSNVGWFNMYTRVAATTYAIEHGWTYDPARIEFLQRLREKGYIEKTPVTEQDVHGYAWKPIFKKETWEVIKMYPSSFVVSQVSSFFTVISQDLTSVYLRKMRLIYYTYPNFSPVVKLSQEGFFATVAATWQILSWPIVLSIVGRFVWLTVFCLSLWSLVVAWKRDRRVFPIVVFLVLYELYIIALSLNAAAQSDARYRTQFVFAEIPLAFYAFVDLVRGRFLKHLTTHPECRVCGSRSEVRSWGTKRSHHLFVCGMCHAAFVSPLPTSEELTSFYSDSYFFGGGSHGGYVDYDADKRAAQESLVAFLQHLEHWVPEKGKLLDVGAATGAFLEVAKTRGWNIFGHEISVDAAQRARAKEIPMTTGELSMAGYEPQFFDAVTGLDVIEHVEDPQKMIRSIAHLLHPGGCMLLNTPDRGSWYARLLGLNWHAYNPPEHLTIFDRRSLSFLVERAGFDVLWAGKVKKSFRVSYILHTFSHWTRVRLFSRLAAAIERRSRWNWSIPLNLRDNIVLIARKRV